MAATCEVLVNGQPCGVSAIGRCSSDGAAFCMTHQARKPGLGPIPDVTYTDMCTVCFGKSQAAIVQVSRQNEERFGTTYLLQAAQQELIEAGVPRVRILVESKTERRMAETKKRFGGTKRDLQDVRVETWGEGWVIGECAWRYRTFGGGYGREDDHKGRLLTAMLDEKSVQDPSWRFLTVADRFVAVSQLETGEYYARYTAQSPGAQVDNLKEVAEAVHRMAGT